MGQSSKSRVCPNPVGQPRRRCPWPPRQATLSGYWPRAHAVPSQGCCVLSHPPPLLCQPVAPSSSRFSLPRPCPCAPSSRQPPQPHPVCKVWPPLSAQGAGCWRWALAWPSQLRRCRRPPSTSTGSSSAMRASSSGSRTGPRGNHTRCLPLPEVPLLMLLRGKALPAEWAGDLGWSQTWGRWSSLLGVPLPPPLQQVEKSWAPFDPQPSLPFSPAPRWFP